MGMGGRVIPPKPTWQMTPEERAAYDEERRQRVLQSGYRPRGGISPYWTAEQEAGQFAGVYFVQFKEFIKIGSSWDVLMRQKDLNSYLPIPVIPLGWIPALEHRVHERAIQQGLLADQCRGDWFHDTPRVRAFIERYAVPFPEEPNAARQA